MGCPLWVISRHNSPFASCPLYPRQRTSVGAGGMSEKCQIRALPAWVHASTLSDGSEQPVYGEPALHTGIDGPARPKGVTPTRPLNDDVSPCAVPDDGPCNLSCSALGHQRICRAFAPGDHQERHPTLRPVIMRSRCKSLYMERPVYFLGPTGRRAEHIP